MKRRTALLAMPLIAALVAASVWPAVAEVAPDVIERAILRTVFLGILMRVPGQEGRLAVVGTCSGSFVSATGLILTASHCVRATSDDARLGVRKGQLYHPDGLMAVSVNLPDRARPVLVMIARTLEDDARIDMALLKIAALIGKGSPEPIPPDLRVPFLPLGDADAVRHGEAVAVIGFPGVGGETVTANKGNVTGFTADEQNRKLEMKLDAGVGPGSSGGPVITERGEQVAVLSGGIVDPQAQARSVRAPLVSRMPGQWTQAIRDEGGRSASSPGPSSPGPSSPGPSSPGAGRFTTLRGRIVDASTGAGIEGAGIFILRPGASPRTATKQDIIAGAIADGNGLYEVSPRVRTGATYPVAILATGYEPVTGTLEVPAGAPEVFTVRPVQLQRQ